MKSFPAQFSYFLRIRAGRRNLRLLGKFFLVLAGLVTLYSVLFHILMALEGQDHTWITGFYWTLTVMSTLGFGDITFHTDLGRLFSILVLLSGMVFMLVLLPFTFIEFFYAPWMQAQAASRAPRQLPAETRDHVVLTHWDEVTAALVGKLRQYGYSYVMIVDDLTEALRLHDEGTNVMLGNLDSPETYRHARVDRAALMVTTGPDPENTNAAITVREISSEVPIVSTANFVSSVDILEMAGCNHVLQLGEEMGRALARRVISGDAVTHLIGEFGPLQIAESVVAGTPLVGKQLGEANLRELAGVTAVGLWERGQFHPALPEVDLTPNTVLVLAGSREQLHAYDELLCIYNVTAKPVVIIGGGRVGRATGRALAERGIDYRIVEKRSERFRDPEKYVLGDAAEIEVLKRAGIDEASTICVTTHDDATNIYLTIYCRRLRPDAGLISRATYERNVPALHRAGADFVLSYATMGANAILNQLEGSDEMVIAEGLNVFRVRVPRALVGRSLLDSRIRERTGCSVVAVTENGDMRVGPSPEQRLAADEELILIGTVDAERLFLERFPSA